MKYKIQLVIIASALLAVCGSISYMAYSQEAKYDRIFNSPQYDGLVYQTVINGTVYETTNQRQIVFYYWSDLSENAKRIVNQTMVLNGYTISERSLHFD